MAVASDPGDFRLCLLRARHDQLGEMDLAEKNGKSGMYQPACSAVSAMYGVPSVAWARRVEAPQERAAGQATSALTASSSLLLFSCWPVVAVH